MTNLLLTNARALDTRGGDLSPPSDILIQDGKIADIGAGRPAGEAETIDVGGRVVMAGFMRYACACHGSHRQSVRNPALVAGLCDRPCRQDP